MRREQHSWGQLNAVLVGAALIGGVSFSGWLQLPSETAFQKAEMKVFWWCNGMSFYTAMAAMCVAIAALVPTPAMYVVGIANQLKWELLLAVSFLWVSLAGVVMAFAGGPATPPPEPPPHRKATAWMTVTGGGAHHHHGASARAPSGTSCRVPRSLA